MEKFITKNSPDGGFLQSKEWRDFQSSVGRQVYEVKGDDFFAGIIEHKLPLAGKYFYIPRGPILGSNAEMQKMQTLIDLAKEKNAGWIRIEPKNDDELDAIEKSVELKIVKAPHEMQPSQIFLLNIAKSEKDLLKEMKPKTRYNIRLAERKGVECFSYSQKDAGFKKNFEKFLELVEQTAVRKKVRFHQREYYTKMTEIIPEENLRLFTANYKRETIVANLVVFYGKTATYLHGASSDKYKNVMAPFLLQWQTILEAKKRGCKKYDLGGVKIVKKSDGEYEIADGSRSGISRFKTGFSKSTKPIEFVGCYDIVVDRKKYFIYKLLQKIKKIITSHQ